MERVYLLLRNNQQSGPFTIGELLQQQLRSSDMIWIEGKSSAWIYLSELELIPLVKNQESSGTQQSITSSDEIEKKAEELRQKVLTSAPKNQYTKPNLEIGTFSSSYKLPEDEIQFIDHRKETRIKQTTFIGELLLTGAVIGLFMVGIYKGKSFLGARHKVQSSVATRLATDDDHAAKKNAHPAAVGVLPADTATKNIAPADTSARWDSLHAMPRMKPKIATIKKPLDTLHTVSAQTTKASVQDQPDKREEAVLPPPLPVAQKNVSDIPLKKEVHASAPGPKTNNENVKEEKRGFLRGLFKKKKKEDRKDGTR